MLNEQAQLKTATQLYVEKREAESEEALAVRGDADSFILLYRRYLGPVYRYAYSRLGNRQEAEDVTSVCFERAWASLPRYRSTGSFKAWLFTLAHRAVCDHYRHRQANTVQVDSVAEALLDPSKGPDEAAIASEQHRNVLQLLSTLSQEQQEVLALRFMSELRYSEIAKVLNKRESAIKMIAYRALEEIRRRYSDVHQDI